MTMIGMDVTEVRSLAKTFSKTSNNLEHIKNELSQQLTSAGWNGSDAESFNQLWNSNLKLQLTNTAHALAENAKLLNTQADQQEQASNSTDSNQSNSQLINIHQHENHLAEMLTWLKANSAFSVQSGNTNNSAKLPVRENDSWWNNLTNPIINGGNWIGEKFVQAYKWSADRLRDGKQFVDKVWNRVTKSLDAFAIATLRENILMARILARFIEHPPSLAELSSALILINRAKKGKYLNLIAGKDLHNFDDGKPSTGKPYIDKSQNNNSPKNFPAFTKMTMKAYNDKLTDCAEIRVSVIRNPNQSPRYVVAIPGTEASIINPLGWGGTTKANDWDSNLELMVFGESSYSRATIEAIDKAVRLDRAQHPNETGKPNIVLTGHSQGGIVAAYLGANRQFREQYNINGVVTYGAPVDCARVPTNVPILSLDNKDDVVPQTDLGGRPDGPENITKIKLPTNNPNNIAYNHKQLTYEDNVDNMSAANQNILNNWSSTNGLDNFYLKPTGSSYMIKIPVKRTYN